ncbi:MAG: methyltransferase [Maricaulaceae bacterium]
MIRKIALITTVAVLALTACSKANETVPSSETVQDTVVNTVKSAEAVVESITVDSVDTAKLEAILNAQPDTVKARYGSRNPGETLKFFGVEPGMTIIEILPGGGWYSKIVSPYLGSEGHVIGLDYDIKMWSEFGGFATPEFIEKRKSWAQSWPETIASDLPENSSQLSAYTLGSIPSELNEKIDMVLMIRALHNLARFNDEGQYLDAALTRIYKSLKPGGIAGIVQHKGPAENADDWADGNNGYLKTSFVIEQMEKVGFEFIEASDINDNPRDVPSNTDNVWRLPPTLGTSRDDAELRSKMELIGESSRMTLKFVKPK